MPALLLARCASQAAPAVRAAVQPEHGGRSPAEERVRPLSGRAVVPPRLAKEGLAFIPAAHPELPAWRHNFQGVRVDHAASGLTVFGAIDDLWVDAAGRHYVVDYKATAKADEVSLDADWQIAYKRQVEFYQWLLRGRGLDVADRAFFVYANGIKDDGPFDDVLRFRTKILAYDGNAHWVEPTLMAAARVPGAGRAAGVGSGVRVLRLRREDGALRSIESA